MAPTQLSKAISSLSSTCTTSSNYMGLFEVNQTCQILSGFPAFDCATLSAEKALPWPCPDRLLYCCTHSVGLYSTGLEALYLPSFKTEEKSPESATETSVVQWIKNSCTSEAKSWSDTPLWGAGGGQGMAAIVTTLRGGGCCQLQGELISGCLISYHRNQQSWHTPLHLFDKNNHQLGTGASMSGQSCEQGVGEAGTGQAGNVQRAKEQPP